MKTTMAFLALAMAACTNGQADTNVTTSEAATFPPTESCGGPMDNPTTMTTETDVTLDVHDELSSLAKDGTLSLAISEDSVSGEDLSLVDKVTATLGVADGSMPVVALGQIAVPPGGTTVSLPSLLAEEQVLAYLKAGPVLVHVTLIGANLPPRPITLKYVLAAHVSISVAGSVRNPL